MKNKIVNFKVIDSKNNVVIDKYSIKYNTADELKNIIDEARQVWYEFSIKVETDLFTQSFSHTYQEELMLGLR